MKRRNLIKAALAIPAAPLLPAVAQAQDGVVRISRSYILDPEELDSPKDRGHKTGFVRISEDLKDFHFIGKHVHIRFQERSGERWGGLTEDFEAFPDEFMGNGALIFDRAWNLARRIHTKEARTPIDFTQSPALITEILEKRTESYLALRVPKIVVEGTALTSPRVSITTGWEKVDSKLVQVSTFESASGYTSTYRNGVLETCLAKEYGRGRA